MWHFVFFLASELPSISFILLWSYATCLVYVEDEAISLASFFLSWMKKLFSLFLAKFAAIFALGLLPHYKSIDGTDINHIVK